ncbi:MAG: alcohol dehydrogenase family protein [Rhizobiales bacterium]|nr:alcohol dehydrogenase family protein [Hyphomicrobiales bacterium]MBI3674841.1 alcohol dehydrogenase family protein [Hyphomicrobiales bacterium]
MKAVVTTGNGGYDRLVYRDVPRPVPGPGEVLIRVLAAGVNNTEINTRLGWYSSGVTSATSAVADEQEKAAVERSDGGWNKATPFPLIQGTDCCGRVVEAFDGANQGLIGRRVLVRACMRPAGFASMENVWMASDFDGAFAQFVKVPARDVFAVDCNWSDVDLATIPCSYATAENMLHRASLGEGERVLVTGASGGVGSAVVQLARRRGARVTAITSRDKMAAVTGLGCARVIARDDDALALLGEESVDLVVDNVAGPGFASLLRLLRRGGRYVSSGAIAGPLVSFDMRDLYLKDLTLIGCTAWDEPVFPNLVSYIERGEIRPLVAGVFPLEKIAEAQRQFLAKRHVGNFVLVPP